MAADRGGSSGADFLLSDRTYPVRVAGQLTQLLVAEAEQAAWAAG